MGADMCYENYSNVMEHYGGGAASATVVWEGLFEKLKRNQNQKDGEGVAMQSLGKNARSRAAWGRQKHSGFGGENEGS